MSTRKWAAPILALIVVAGGCGSAGTQTSSRSTASTSTSTTVPITSRGQAVRLARKDFDSEIRLPGQKSASLKDLHQQTGPATSTACTPAIDRTKVVTAVGSIVSTYNYLKKRITLPLSAWGFIRDAKDHNRILSGTLGYEPPIPKESRRPIWNGFGYGITPGHHHRVFVRIDAFVVEHGAKCYQASGGGGAG